MEVQEQEKCQCNGTFLVNVGGRRVFCRCFTEKYLKAKLGILGIPSVAPECREFVSAIPKADMKKVLIMAKGKTIEEVKGIIACMWIKANISCSLEHMNCYRLVDIYLGKDPTYSNLPMLISDVLVLYVGYNEFRNQRIPEFILHVFEMRRDKTNWLVYKNPTEDMSIVSAYLKENDFKTFTFTGVSSQPVKTFTLDQ